MSLGRLFLEPSRICANCGRPIPPDQAECACAARPRRYWLHSRETLLFITVCLLILFFAVTTVWVRNYHGRRSALARYWFERGTTELSTGKPSDAVAAFRTALTYAREDVSDAQQHAFELELAQALMATDRFDEARSYLLDLYDTAPGNAEVNLQLARLSVQQGDNSAAILYYNGAIYGVWSGGADQVLRKRLDTQLEFYRYLTSQNQPAAAQAVLEAMAASLPPDPDLHTQVGQLMLESGQPRQALTEFTRALQLDSRDQKALTGAGIASFQLDDDRNTVRYLEEALRQQPKRPKNPLPGDEAVAAQDLAIAQAAASLDSFQRGISNPERARRTASAYNTAVHRLQTCAQQNGVTLEIPRKGKTAAPAQNQNADPLQALYTRAGKMKDAGRESELLHNPEMIESLMNLAFDIERETASRCGSPSNPADAALLRIAGRAENATP